MNPAHTVWTAEQVRALAPDAGSLAATRKLAGRWRGTGAHEHAVWGLCQGSGATPYRTVVDLSGPAYKCSCPSRKFPCKHALSLLLTWAAGEVPAADTPPDFAAEWLRGRATRAAAPAKKAAEGTAPATVEQRRARVTAGLAELQTWLADQVRTGLAQADRSFAAFEAVAARMVDAQAPGVASALRRLPLAVAAGADWPETLLREYGRLQLLVTAHRELDALPEPLRASVRAHVGYPTQAETVRAEPAVRDTWLVLATRTSEEERLHTRRTWLYGRASHRWALLLEHSFGAPNFTGEVPVLGHEVDAEVHYYPGAAPLRVQWGARHGAPRPFTTVPTGDGGTVGAALRGFAEALGADPWSRSRPAVVHGVTPVPGADGWHLVDADGAALALHPGDRPWRLAALSGGHPVTVVGEQTARGFDVLSVIAEGSAYEVAGERLPAAPGARPEFADLVSVALLGTARRAPDHLGLDDAVAAAVPRAGDPAVRVLTAAALQDLYLTGGALPGTAEPPEPAEDDPRPALPTPAAARLAALLTDKSAFLPEWLEAAAPFGYRLPAALLVPVLTAAAADTGNREALLRLAGPRGRWLAGLNPEWRRLGDSFAGHAPVVDVTVTDPWLFGTAVERRDWLTALRAADPAGARAALAAAWPGETGPVKAELLAVLADGLSADDEDQLESVLDDRRGDVRRTAAHLLARLPGSGYAARMTERARDWFGTAADGSVTVRVPADLDDAARRDGITDRGAEFAYRWEGLPDLDAVRVRQVVAATPLAAWRSLAAATPRGTLALPLPERFRQPVVDGWIDATLAQRDTAWAAALFALGRPTDQAMLRRRELFALLEPEEQIAQVLTLDAHWITELQNLLPGFGHRWPEPIAAHILTLLGRRARTTVRDGSYYAGTYADRSLLAAASVHLPPELAAEATALAEKIDDPAWEQAFHRLARDLTDRATMLEELR
ncbi:DUF5691 domain-containing protein [Nocardia thailandica]